jgi:hypothetical protein
LELVHLVMDVVMRVCPAWQVALPQEDVKDRDCLPDCRTAPLK